MPIADDWKINYVTKQIYHTQWKDEIDATDSSLPEQRSVTTVGSASLDNSGTADHFHLYSAQDVTRYYVWYNVSGGSNTDPAVVGATGIQVNVGAADTLDQVATATVSAINNHATAKYDFTAAGATSPITLHNHATNGKGSCTNASDDATQSTGFTIVVTQNGIGRTIFSANALYSYLQDTFDELGQMDDKVPMSAQTPTDYTIINEWFIDEVSIKYLTGGALKTDGWLRAVGTNTGIVQIVYASGSPAGTDFGLPIIEETDLDAGTVLFIDTTRKYIWIRPDSFAIGNSFDSTSSHNVDITGGTQNIPRTAAAARSGENLWANVYTLGTIQTLPYPQIYIFQNGSSIPEWSTLTNWDRGQIDVLIRVKEMGTEIDGASITVFARQGSDSYDHFTIDLTSGGRNAVPLSTATDLNYTSGDYYLLYNTEVGGPFTANEVIKHDAATSLWSARIVSITDWGTTGLLKLTNFKQSGAGLSSGQPLIGTLSKATANTNGTLGDTYTTSSAEGTQLTIGLVCTGSVTTAKRILRGIQDDGATSKYVFQVSTSATGAARNPYYKAFTTSDTITDTSTGTITCGLASTTIVAGWDDITIAFVNGTATFTTGSGSFIYGEKVTFTGGTGIVLYNSNNGGATGTLTLGNMTITAINGLVITGAISSAQATASQALQSGHTLTKFFTQQSAFPYDIIVNAGDIYNAGRTLAQVYEYFKFITQENSTFSMYTVVSAVITILDGEEYIQAYFGYTPVKSAPFGTFAGGTLFGAQGVWIEGMAAGQTYTFNDSDGTNRTPYASITISVSSVVALDRVTVFRTLAGVVHKSMYTSVDGATNAIGDTTFVVAEAISSDTPDSGIIRLVDVSANTEHRLRYVSWATSTFTLVTASLPTGTADSGDVTGTTFTDAGANFSLILPGDLVRNTTDGSWAHVITVNDTTDTITHTPLQGGSENDWDTGDSYSFNNLPVLYAANDTAYVPFLDETATSTTVSKTVLYNSNRDVLIRVRKKGILPFETSGSVTTSGLSVAAIRTTDSIVT